MTNAPPPPPLPSDDELAGRARAGDLGAFNALVERYQRAVFGLCLRMVSSVPAAEDAAQETFFSAWRGLKGYRGGSFQAWILRIAGNQCRDDLRKRRRRPATSLEGLVAKEGEGAMGPAAGRLPEERSLDAETAAVIQEGLAGLSANQRMAIILSDVQGLAYEEIATVMGTSVGTVKSRISRGRARLRTYLQARGELPSARQRLAEEEGPSDPSPARSHP